MKYNKKEKQWLKKNKIWELVKKRTKACIDKPETDLSAAFTWEYTEEGYEYWYYIYKRMHGEI